MNIVIDTNVLIAALMRNSTTRKILVKADCDFFMPELVLEEARKYENEIRENSKLTAAEHKKLLERLLRYVKITPTETCKLFEEEATKIIGNIDKDDILIVAAALAMEPAYVWSNDKDFARQKEVKVLTTAEVARMFEV